MDFLKIKLLFLIFLATWTGQAWSSEVSYTYSQSNLSESNKYKLSYNFDRQNKIGLSYRSSQDSTGAVDNFSSTFKFNYRYRTESYTTYSLDVKKTDESYFYEGVGAVLKLGLQVTPSGRINFNFEGNQKNYTLLAGEVLFQTGYLIGYDHDLSESWSVGVDYSGNYYSGGGGQSSNALRQQTITTTDISTYINYLIANSISFFVDYNSDKYSVGMNYSVDTSVFGNRKFNSTEIYGEYSFTPDWMLSLSYTQGKSDGSLTSTDTVGIGLSNHF